MADLKPLQRYQRKPCSVCSMRKARECRYVLFTDTQDRERVLVEAMKSLLDANSPGGWLLTSLNARVLVEQWKKEQS